MIELSGPSRSYSVIKALRANLGSLVLLLALGAMSIAMCQQQALIDQLRILPRGEETRPSALLHRARSHSNLAAGTSSQFPPPAEAASVEQAGYLYGLILAMNSSLQAIAASKADRDDLQKLRAAVDDALTEKADSSDLEVLRAAVDDALQGKADSRDLETLRASVDKKVDADEFQKAVASKADQSQVRALISTISTISGKWTIAGMFMTYGGTTSNQGRCGDIDTTGMCQCPSGTQDLAPHTGELPRYGVARLHLCVVAVPGV